MLFYKPYDTIKLYLIFGSDFVKHNRKSILSRLLALTAAAVMSSAMLTGCSDSKDNDTSQASETSSVSETTASEKAEETTAADVFGSDYDPFAEDYDPYGEGISKPAAKPADTISADTESNAEATDDSTAKITAKPAETTSSPAVTDAPKQTEAKPAEQKSGGASAEASSDKNVTVEIKQSNGWESGSDKFAQFDIIVTNNGDKSYGSWSVTFKTAKNASIEQSWNCGLEVSGGNGSASPVEFNSVLEPGQSVNCGFILKNPGTVDSSSAQLKLYKGASQSGSQTSGSSGNQSASTVGNNSAPVAAAKDVPAPSTDDWLSVKNGKIVDSSGKEVWLTGVNWFGYNTGTNTFDGLWACDLNTSLAAIADHGFNLLRVPISTELIKQWSNGEYPTANFNQATNSYLVGMNSLEIFDYVVGQCRANGIKIMIDIHSAKTDASGHMKNVWYEGNITEADYINALGWIAKRYANDDTIIAYDLKNEPHGKPNENPRAVWNNSKSADNWKYIAEKAAMSVLKNNPNALIMVEGIEIYPKDIKTNGDFASKNDSDYYYNWWGGNLRGVKDHPIDLGKYQNKLVYSPHDYGPAVYQQPWFKGDYTFDSLYKDCWYDNWFFIQKEGIAPLLIGEWGGYMTQPNLKWMTYMRQLIKENRINHTFWCFNANSGDTGGLVKDDFTTWDTEKYNFVKEVLWQQDGKFVGLDHKIPLGKNGITLSEAN